MITSRRVVSPFILISTLVVLGSLVAIYVFTQGDLSKLQNLDFRSRADYSTCNSRCENVVCRGKTGAEFSACMTLCRQANHCGLENSGTPHPTSSAIPRPTSKCDNATNRDTARCGAVICSQFAEGRSCSEWPRCCRWNGASWDWGNTTDQ